MLVSNVAIEVVAAAPVTTLPLSVRAEWNVTVVPAGLTQVLSQSWLVSSGTQTVVPNNGQNYVSSLSTLSVVNQDTAAATVTVQTNNGTTLYPIYKVTLAAGDNLFYQTDRGFWVVDSSGNARGIVPLPLGAAKDATLTTLAKESGGNIAAIAATTATLAVESGGRLDAINQSTRVQNMLALRELALTLVAPSNGFVPVEVPSFLVG